MGDVDALYVCTGESLASGPSVDDVSQWHRFGDPASISSVIYSLGEEEVVGDLMRSYPSASAMLKDGTWSSHLMLNQFPKVKEEIQNSNSDDMAEDEETSPEKDEVVVIGGFDVSLSLSDLGHLSAR